MTPYSIGSDAYCSDQACRRDDQRDGFLAIRRAEKGGAAGVARSVGFALLASGVIVQLFGYASDGGWWLLGLAVGVVLLAAFVGRTIADDPVTSWLHKQAVDYWNQERPS